MFRTRSLLFHPSIEDSLELSDQIILPVRAFHSMIEQYQDETVLYANLIHTENNIQYLVTLSATHDLDEDMIFVPQWILDHIGPSEEPIFRVEKAVEDLPVANHLMLRPLDHVDVDLDLASYAERAMVNLHSIQENTTLPIYIDHQILYVYVQQVDPAPLSRIVQGEVTVEFVVERPPTPEPIAPFTEEPLAEEPLAEEPSVETSAAPSVEPSAEERRQRLRDAWAQFNPT